MSDISVPISPSEIDRKLLLDTLDNMDVVRSGGKVVQGLVNRRSREKDNAEDINPAFPTAFPIHPFSTIKYKVSFTEKASFK